MNSKAKLRKVNLELDRVNSANSNPLLGILAVFLCLTMAIGVSILNSGITGMSALDNEMPKEIITGSLIIYALIFAALILVTAYVAKKQASERNWLSREAAKTAGIITFIFGIIGQLMIRIAYKIALYVIIPLIKAVNAISAGIKYGFRYLIFHLKKSLVIFHPIVALLRKMHMKIVTRTKGNPFEPEIEKINWELENINRAEKQAEPGILRIIKIKNEIKNLKDKIREINIRENAENKK